MTFSVSFMGEKWNIIPIPLKMDERAFKNLMWEWAGQHPQMAKDSDQVRLKIDALSHENNVSLGADQRDALLLEIVGHFTFRNSQAR